MKDVSEANAPMKAATFTGAIHDLAGQWMAFVYRHSERVASLKSAQSAFQNQGLTLT
jgi:hypothetical protein